MSSSSFMDDYSSEDYSDHDDDYCFVPSATSPPQVEIRTPESDELQNLIVIDQQEVVVESVYFEVLPELEAETAEEGGGGMEQSIYLAVESYFDNEAQAETGGGVAALEVETTVEVFAVESYNLDLEALVETGSDATVEAETILEFEGDVIGSKPLEIVEADTALETVERMIEEFNFEAVESESDLEVEGYAIKEPHLDGENEADGVAPEAAKNAVDGDVIGESIFEVIESDYDLEAKAGDMVEEVEGKVEEANDVVEEDDLIEEEDEFFEEEDGMVQKEDNMVEREDNVVEEEDGMVEEEDVVEEEGDFVEEEDDVIDEPLELDNNPQAEAHCQALVEEVGALEESIFEPLESNFDLQAEEPAALAEPAVVSTTFKTHEPDFDFEQEEPEDPIDEPSGSVEEESDLNEEEQDSDAEEIAVDPEDSDTDDSSDDSSDRAEEEEEDDVVVSYLNSSTTIRSKTWPEFLVPASQALASWARLPVTDDTAIRFEDSSLRWEIFLGCRPMLVLQECGNAVMNVIETLLCELSRIRDDLRRVLGALFRKRETTKYA